MKKIIFLAPFLLVLTMLHACANNTSLPRVHPEEVHGLPDCSECHTDQWSALNHRGNDFFIKHRFYAEQRQDACMVCHQESFCVECHAHKEEIKPNEKYRETPELWLPHRGDYLAQHQIDGRINPASCMKCHGRQNNERCRTCHR